MDAVFVNIVLGFFEGFALIISPCILPILPIVLSGSLAGKKSRPIGIIAGFVIAFTIVTLFSRALFTYAHLSSETLRDTSYLILVLLGVMMMSTYLTDKFNVLTSRFANIGSSIQAVNNPQSGFAGGVIFGALVGIVWTPCAGPILAAVIVQAIVQRTTLDSVLVVAAFAIGAGLPMLLIALIGRRIMEKFRFFREHTVLFRKILGLIIILSVPFLIYYTNISLAVTQSGNQQAAPETLVNGLEQSYPAPEIAGIDAWINSPPLKISELKGKVVLIDFWTYSCINCIRTLPYLKNWYAKYHGMGFEIIGVHSPEFEFEHDLNNVKHAVDVDGIHYPVALDNHFVTWQNFHNQYWPAHYLINKNGEVVYEHFGEGEYDVTENNIRYLLGLKGPAETASEQNYLSELTPETYFGYARAENFSSPEAVMQDKVATYSYPAELAVDHWALNGKWTIYRDKIVAASAGASIKLHFTAKEVYAVMGASEPVNVKVIPPGKSSIQMMVSHDQLYTVVHLKHADEGTVELIASSPGLEMYTFTFGD